MSKPLAVPIYSLNLSSTDPELLSSVERRGARVDEIDDLVDGLPFKVNDKGRLVVLEGNLQLLEKGDWQERRLFVFTDCLIWAKYKKKKKSDWSYCGHIMFGSCILSANAVKDTVRTKTDAKRLDAFVFEIVEMGHGKHTFTWKCDSERQHAEWVRAIDTQLSAFLKAQAEEHKQLLEANTKALLAQEAFEKELANLEAFKKQRDGASSSSTTSTSTNGPSAMSMSSAAAPLNKSSSVPTNLAIPLSPSSAASAVPAGPTSPSRSGGSLVKQLANRMRDKSPSPQTSPRSDDEGSGSGSGSAVVRSKGSLLGNRLKLSKNRMTVHGATPFDPGSASTSPRAKARARAGSADFDAADDITTSISVAEALLADERRYASTVLDTLLKDYWIPLCQQQVIDVDALPRLFTNLDQISAVHVGVLAAIDARVQEQEKSKSKPEGDASRSDSTSAADNGKSTSTQTDLDKTFANALACVTCIVERLLHGRDKDDGMLTLYQKYRANLGAALAYADAQRVAAPKFEEFFRRDLDKGQTRRLRRLLLAPGARFCEYARLFKRLRPHVPVQHPLGLLIDHVTPLIDDAARDEQAVLAALPMASDDVGSGSTGSSAAANADGEVGLQAELDRVNAKLGASQKTLDGLRVLLQNCPKGHASRARVEAETTAAESSVSLLEARRDELKKTLAMRQPGSPRRTSSQQSTSPRKHSTLGTASATSAKSATLTPSSSSSASSSSTSVTQTTAKKLRVRALETAESDRAGDLAFAKGDVFMVIAQPTENIWKGVHNGKVGRFLSRVVEVIHDDDEASTSKANGSTEASKPAASPRAASTPASSSTTTTSATATTTSTTTSTTTASSTTSTTTTTTTGATTSPRAMSVPALQLPTSTTELVKQKIATPRSPLEKSKLSQTHETNLASTGGSPANASTAAIGSSMIVGADTTHAQ